MKDKTKSKPKEERLDATFGDYKGSKRFVVSHPIYVRWYEECAQFIVTERDGFRSYPMDRSWRYEILGNVCDNIELLREVDNG